MNTDVEDWPPSKRHKVLPQSDEGFSSVKKTFDQLVNKAIKSIMDAESDKFTRFRYYVVSSDSARLSKLKEEVNKASDGAAIFKILLEARFISIFDVQNLKAIIDEFCEACKPDMEAHINALTDFLEQRLVPVSYCTQHHSYHNSKARFCIDIDPKHEYFCDHEIPELTQLIANIVHRHAADLLIHKI